MPWRVWWSQEIGLGEVASAGDIGLCRVFGDFDHLIGFLVSGGLMLLLCARKLLVNCVFPPSGSRLQSSDSSRKQKPGCSYRAPKSFCDWLWPDTSLGLRE